MSHPRSQLVTPEQLRASGGGFSWPGPVRTGATGGTPRLFSIICPAAGAIPIDSGAAAVRRGTRRAGGKSRLGFQWTPDFRRRKVRRFLSSPSSQEPLHSGSPEKEVSYAPLLVAANANRSGKARCKSTSAVLTDAPGGARRTVPAVW